MERARKTKRNLWGEAETLADVILLSPEQLISTSCEGLVRSKYFLARICFLGVDEVHLINSWGEGFRKSFTQIGFVRARISSSHTVTVIAATATLRPGKAHNNVCATLGLHADDFYHLRRSNHRPELSIRFRTLRRGLGGWIFPDLAWILDGTRRTVVFCRTISLSFKVALYLRGLAPPSPSHDTRIRMYNSLNWPSYNEATRHLFRTTPDAQIIVATTSFMVGLDFPDISDTILLGHPPSVDELLQWAGRTGRDHCAVQDARCITYLAPKASETARAILDGTSSKKKHGGKPSADAETKMDEGMAAMILAPCKIAKQNELYDNPEDRPCLCEGCSARREALQPWLGGCTCSGCLSDINPPLRTATPSTLSTENTVKPGQRLSKAMREYGTFQLINFQRTVYLARKTTDARFLPPTTVFPSLAIKDVLDHFALIQSLDDVIQLMRPYSTELSDHLPTLWRLCRKLRRRFEQMAHDHKEALKAKQLEKATNSQRSMSPILQDHSQAELIPASVTEVSVGAVLPAVRTLQSCPTCEHRELTRG